MARRLRGVIGTIAAWFVVVTGVGLLVVLGIGPRTGRYRTLTVLSGSMSPGIPVGSVVVVTPERPDRLRVGQIITYAIPVEDHRVVSHRVVRILEGGARPTFQTKGDANDAPDQWTAQLSGDTIWSVRYVVPRLGLGLHWLRQPLVHNVSVLVVPLGGAIVALFGIWRGGQAGEPADESILPRSAAQAQGAR